MKASRLLLVLVALIAGSLAAWLATRGGGEAPPPDQPAQVVKEARAQVLVAKTPIGVGEKIIADDLEWQDWPEGAVRPEYITEAATPNAMSDIRGSVARFEIFPGEPVLSSKLVKADQGYLSAVLDKGRRGVSITVAAEAASGGFIVPNDHVDVILTRQTAGGGAVSEVLLANVRVLAINTRLGEIGKTGAPDDGTADEKGDPKAQIFANSAIATLDLDPGQAETVINATSQGKLSLALRSIVDFPETATTAEVQRNAPIRVIRYGVQANITAAINPQAGADASVDPAAYQSEPPPRVGVTVTTGAGVGNPGTAPE